MLKFTHFEGLDNLSKQLFLLVPHSALVYQWLLYTLPTVGQESLQGNGVPTKLFFINWCLLLNLTAEYHENFMFWTKNKHSRAILPPPPREDTCLTPTHWPKVIKRRGIWETYHCNSTQQKIKKNILLPKPCNFFTYLG